MPIILKGATSGQVTLDTPAIAGTNNLELPAATGTIQLLKLETAQATTSGTFKDFLNIPSWAKKITVMFNSVSTNGTSNYLIQLGAGSIETTSYNSGWTYSSTGGTTTTGFNFHANVVAANVHSGIMTLGLIGSNLWVSSSIACATNTGIANMIQAGSKTLSGTLDRLRLTTVNGTDTFDAGSVNILIEGN